MLIPPPSSSLFFFTAPSPTETYTLSLHDALPISTTLETSRLGTFPVTWKARSDEAEGGTTSPEELLGSAHATCLTMQLSNMLAENGTPPTSEIGRAHV